MPGHNAASRQMSILTCPHCGHQAAEAVPEDACLYFYECKGCGRTLRPKAGDCCVFCSYGDAFCPSRQAERRRDETLARPI